MPRKLWGCDPLEGEGGVGSKPLYDRSEEGEWGVRPKSFSCRR